MLFESICFPKIIFRDKIYTHDFTDQKINQLIDYIKSQKLNTSPFIYLFAPNHVKTIIAYFAIIKADYIVLLLPPKVKSIELNLIKEKLPPCAFLKIDESCDHFDLSKEFIKHDSIVNIKRDIQLKNICTICLTSADDGNPKAAMLSKENMVENARAGGMSDALTTRNVSCALLPFHHLFGLQTGVLTPIFNGSSLLIEEVQKIQKIRKFAYNISKYKVTDVYTIPTIYYLLSKINNIKYLLSGVERFCSGGQKLSESVYQIFLKKTGKKIAEGYGMTETSPVCSWHRKNDKIKPGTVGRAYPCCEIKILKNGNLTTKAGVEGEICVFGKNVFKGYYNDIEGTKKVLKNGWLYTGDIGVLDEDGFLTLKGIKKRMFIRNGTNFYPEEVKKLLKLNKNMEKLYFDVEHDDVIGNNIIANIKLKNDGKVEEKKFIKWCFKHLSPSKLPNVFKFFYDQPNFHHSANVKSSHLVTE